MKVLVTMQPKARELARGVSRFPTTYSTLTVDEKRIASCIAQDAAYWRHDE
jgi:hypothetical protein